ncbi:D-alanyl-D-alanine carboxypeptidase family protein [Thalassobaculum fulvum]|uniref:D-alanyl-D-alanine carboxypeptidase family protein n=1 Tax=Thalassobaculum fulvum TaxID=1633335 RepID=UPI001E645DCC|nr:D-alanyl-D-alanine carboxypeptidase family protein [Thalassobaculum fulvum]
MLRRHSPIATVLVAVAVAAVMALARPVAAMDTNAREAILMDYDTGQILFAKDADKPMPPASMTKIMTVFLAFERLKDGRLKETDEIPISETAWRKGGSKMFVEVGTRVPLSDILQGIIVQSGNDATIALAEAISGSEEAFAELMTRRAHELGLVDSTFRNSTGWPDPEHRTTAHDLARLAAEVIRRFPEHYALFSETSYTYNNIKQGNRNPLLYKNMGADGLKTGHTENAGYGLTASAKRGDRRLILVVNGLKSVRERSDEAERLLEWGFREFEHVNLARQGMPVETAEVWLGDSPKVPLVSDRDISLSVRRTARKDMTVTVEYTGPIPAPIVAGQPIAMLRVSVPDMEDRSFPLYAGADVGRLGPVGRITSALGHLIWGAGG